MIIYLIYKNSVYILLEYWIILLKFLAVPSLRTADFILFYQTPENFLSFSFFADISGIQNWHVTKIKSYKNGEISLLEYNTEETIFHNWNLFWINQSILYHHSVEWIDKSLLILTKKIKNKP